MCNQDIKEEIKRTGVFQYQIADKLGVCEMTLIRRMRKPLPQEEKAKIRTIIKELSSEFPSTGKMQSNGCGTLKEGA